MISGLSFFLSPVINEMFFFLLMSVLVILSDEKSSKKRGKILPDSHRKREVQRQGTLINESISIITFWKKKNI